MKECGVTPEHARGLGHLLYVTMFKDQSVLNSISDRRVPPYPESFTGGRYAYTFAEKYKLDGEITKRWADKASKEIAQACFSVLKQWRDEAIDRGESRDHFHHDTKDILKVARKGIETPIKDHASLVKLAVAINLGPNFALYSPYR